jgi:hypothetical protein
MVFLDKLAAPVLYGMPHGFEVLSLYLDRQEAIEQGNRIIIVRAEHRRQKKPRLRRLRGLGDAEYLRIRAGFALLIVSFVRLFPCFWLIYGCCLPLTELRQWIAQILTLPFRLQANLALNVRQFYLREDVLRDMLCNAFSSH